MKVLGKVLWGVACIMALQGTGWSSNETPRTGIVEANRHPGKLFEEPLGQRGLKELLTAFSDEEVAKMRSVPEEEPGRLYDNAITMMMEEFARAKGISKKSLYTSIRRSDQCCEDEKYVSERQKVEYVYGTPIGEAVNSWEDIFENKNTSLEQKCFALCELSCLLRSLSYKAEDIRCGYEVKLHKGIKDRAELYDWITEINYRYSLHSLEILLYLS